MIFYIKSHKINTLYNIKREFKKFSFFYNKYTYTRTMKTIEQFYNGFYLNKESSNSQISNCSNPLRIAPIKKLNNYETPQIDFEHFVFAEKNKAWKIEYFHGLKNFLRIEKLGYPPIFIFDNHNHSITFRYYIIHTNKIKNAELIHIDQHSDCRENKNHLQLNHNKDETEKVFTFCNEKCNVGNFIPPAIESWIIYKQTQIRPLPSLENLNTNKGNNFILDIDLDFCLDWIDRNKINPESIKILRNKINQIWKYSLWITIATSPYFLDQEIAINILNDLFYYM